MHITLAPPAIPAHFFFALYLCLCLSRSLSPSLSFLFLFLFLLLYLSCSVASSTSRCIRRLYIFNLISVAPFSYVALVALRSAFGARRLAFWGQADKSSHL